MSSPNEIFSQVYRDQKNGEGAYTGSPSVLLTAAKHHYPKAKLTLKEAQRFLREDSTSGQTKDPHRTPPAGTPLFSLVSGRTGVVDNDCFFVKSFFAPQGFTYVYISVEWVTGMTSLFPCRKISSSNAFSSLLKANKEFPETIKIHTCRTDRGSDYTSALFFDLMKQKSNFQNYDPRT